MLINRDNFRQHTPWIVGSLVVAALATLWYGVAYLGSSGWVSRPSGSSLPGFTFGVLGGLICLFEFFLWPRKHFRSWRVGRVQAWMRAHIWLGLLAVPLLVLHSGFRWGGWLSTVLMALFLLVIVSGVWGLVVQQFLPSRMLEDIQAETIYSQIDRVVGQLGREADMLVLSTCGPEEGEKAVLRKGDDDFADGGAGHFVVGAVRSAGSVQGKVLQTRAVTPAVPEADFLRTFYRGNVKGYLEGSDTASPLRISAKATAMFMDARRKVPALAHGAVDALENMCEQRRQMDEQARIHFWLHNWLWVHLPLSIALILLMFVHVFVSIKYW